MQVYKHIASVRKRPLRNYMKEVLTKEGYAHPTHRLLPQMRSLLSADGLMRATAALLWLVQKKLP